MLLIAFVPIVASAQPSGVDSLLTDPQPLSEGYSVYVSGEDTAWVNPDTDQYKVRLDDSGAVVWYLGCPGSSPFEVAAVADSMEAMVRNDGVQMDPALTVRLGCAINFDLALDTLLSWTPPDPPSDSQEVQDVIYADCPTYVENDTVFLSEGLEADTVAAITPRGNCAGAIPTDQLPTALAVAGESDVIENKGMRTGEAIRLQVYDDGEEYVATPTWEQVDSPIAAQGTYQGDGFHKVTALQ
jgi:hypothetical protein